MPSTKDWCSAQECVEGWKEKWWRRRRIKNICTDKQEKKYMDENKGNDEQWQARKGKKKKEKRTGRMRKLNENRIAHNLNFISIHYTL